MTTTQLPPNPQPYPPYAPSRPVPSPWWVRLPVLFLVGMVLLMLVLATFLVAFQLRYRDTIYPNVWSLGENLGGLSREQAKNALIGRFNYGEQTVFTFRDGDKFWQMTAQDLGVSFDLEATVAQAFEIGHSGNFVNDLLWQLSAWFVGKNIPPVITYNQQTASDKLNTLSQEINQQPLSASLVLDGTNLQTSDGQNGRTLDVATTLSRLEPYITSLQSGAEIPLVINETPPSVYSVASVAQQIQTALSAPISLVASDEVGNTLGPWTASVDQIAGLLRLEVVGNPDGTQSYAVTLDGQAFESYLQTLAPGLIASPQNARYHFNEQTRQLEVIQPSISGRTLNVSETVKRLEEAVFSTTNRTVPMAFDLTLPKYHNQITGAELGIIEMVAESTTYFTGSPQNRRTNIAVSASKFDGIIIAPGEEFSFNYFLGEISEEGGFVEGKVIVGDRTVIGIGGGACQVSTTIFRAAFTGGFAITERNSHGYRVGFYELGGSPPGMDAAIWQPERDFKFQNNTPHHLLIQVSVYPNNDALQFRFYSTKHWRTEVDQAIIKNVQAALPVRYESNADLRAGDILQVDYSAEGADVTVYRRVYDLQGNLVLDDYLYTHYLSWGAIFQVAPGDSRLSNNG
jgi:vancomycin resistance protein YoaR